MIFFIVVKLYVNLGCHIFRSINLEKMKICFHFHISYLENLRYEYQKLESRKATVKTVIHTNILRSTN